MPIVRRRAAPFLFAFLAGLPSAAALAAPANELRFGADWRGYGQFSDQSGFAYSVEALRTLHATKRVEWAAGARAMWSPNERIYSLTAGNAWLAYSRETRLTHVGLPVNFRVLFPRERVTPFLEFHNGIDVLVLERSDAKPDIDSACYGPPFNRTCVGPEDARESARNYPLVWRQAFGFGVRVRMGRVFLTLSQGARWDVTPSRAEIPAGGGSREISPSVTRLGLAF
jgi:hypothetical protein